MDDVDISQILMQRLASKQSVANPVNGFDPYQEMVDRKRNGDNVMAPTIEYSSADIQALEDFCKKHSIVACGLGNMSPKAALRLLKKQVGCMDEVIGYSTSPAVSQKRAILKG